MGLMFASKKSARDEHAASTLSWSPVEEARLVALEHYRTLSARDIEDLSRVAFEAADNLGATQAAISLVDRSRVWFGGAFGLATGDVARQGSFCDAVVRSGIPLVVANARLDPRFWDHAMVRATPRVRSYAGVPLVESSSGHTLGTVAVYSEASAQFSPEILPNLIGVAALVRDFLADACRSTQEQAGPAIQGWFGVKVLAAEEGEVAGAGLVILSVKRGSPAAAAGLRPTDVVHSIERHELHDPADIPAALAGRTAGSHVRVCFKRGWEWRECDVEVKAQRGLRRPW